jgi:hypothetical protein
MHRRNFLRTLTAAITSPALTVAALVYLMLLVAYGTLYQASNGLFEAHHRIFDAWFFMAAGRLPLPGVRLVLLLLCIHLIASGATRFTRPAQGIGLLLIHLGIGIMLIAAAISGMVRSESLLTIAKGETSSTAAMDNGEEMRLPFHCTLLDFSIKYHPGTGTAADFKSRLHVAGPGIDRDVTIAMNRPFRFRDYTLYQSSYREDDDATISELAVVKNPLRPLPPLAAAIIALGLLVHFGIKTLPVVRKRHV